MMQEKLDTIDGCMEMLGISLNLLDPQGTFGSGDDQSSLAKIMDAVRVDYRNLSAAIQSLREERTTPMDPDEIDENTDISEGAVVQHVARGIKNAIFAMTTAINTTGRCADLCDSSISHGSGAVHGLQMSYDRLTEARMWAESALQSLRQVYDIKESEGAHAHTD